MGDHPEERWSEVWENQRRSLISFSKQDFVPCKPSDRPKFSNRSGTASRNMKKLLPQPGWKWNSSWTIDCSPNVDSEGWMYAKGFSSQYQAECFMGASVRRRRWVRSQVRLPPTALEAPQLRKAALSILDRGVKGDGEPRRSGSISSLVSFSSIVSVELGAVDVPKAEQTEVEERPVAASSPIDRMESPNSDLYFSCIEKPGDVSIDDTPNITITPGSPFLGVDPAEDGIISPSPISLKDSMWQKGADEVGAWIVDSKNTLYCAYAKGADIRWMQDFDVLAQNIKCTKVFSAPSSPVWIIDAHGDVYVRITRNNDDTPQIQHKCYENQQWMLADNGKWTSPVNRWAWSDETGAIERTRDSVLLPSDRWEWLGAWKLDSSEQEGWEFALDFTKAFHPKRKFSDSVRRRLWVRTRILAHKNTWAKIELPRSVSRASSIAVGKNGTWVATAGGQNWNVYQRMGLSDTNLEGKDWRTIPIPTSQSAIFVDHASLTLAPNNSLWLRAPDGNVYLYNYPTMTDKSGLTAATAWTKVDFSEMLRSITVTTDAIWGINMEGDVMIRTGITKECPAGVSWKFVSQPTSSSLLTYVTASWEPCMVLCGTENGELIQRDGIDNVHPNGQSWKKWTSEPTFANKGILHCNFSAYVELEELEHPPLEVGDWVYSILDQLDARDQREKDTDRFSHFEAISSRQPQIDPNKCGVLEVNHNGVWEQLSCSISESTNVFSCYSKATNAEIVSLNLETLTRVRSQVEDDDDDDPVTPLSPVRRATKTSLSDIKMFQFEVSSEQGRYRFAAESRKEKEEWVLSLLCSMAIVKQQARGKVLSISMVPSKSAVWAVDLDGNAWFCEPSKLPETNNRILAWSKLWSFLRPSSWGVCHGKFTTISTGPFGVVWALGDDGHVYFYDKTKAAKITEPPWTVVPPVMAAENVRDSIVSVGLAPEHAWAITQRGVVVVRVGVTETNPKGDKWEIACYTSGIKRICLSLGHVYAIKFSGTILVRKGFSIDSPFGTHWNLCNGLMYIEAAQNENISSGMTAVVDVCSFKNDVYTVTSEGKLSVGYETVDDRTLFQKHFALDVVQVSCDAYGQVWALNREGNIFLQRNKSDSSTGEHHKFRSLVSVSNHGHGQQKRWHAVSAIGSGSAISKSKEVILLGNGEAVPQPSSSEPTPIFYQLLKARDETVAKAKARVKKKWLEAVPKPMIHRATRDGTWHPGKLAGAKPVCRVRSFPFLMGLLAVIWNSHLCVQKRSDEHFYLVKYKTTEMHVWLDRSKVCLDRTPTKYMLYEGQLVLAIAEEGTCYTLGKIVRLDSTSCQVATSKDTIEEFLFNQLRLPPSCFISEEFSSDTEA